MVPRTALPPGDFFDIRSELSDEEYWELLGDIWTDSENLWQYSWMLNTLLHSNRPGKAKMMNDDEHDFLAKLPEEFTIYRGHQVRNRLGHS